MRNLVYILLILIICSCNSKTSTSTTDTITKGVIIKSSSTVSKIQPYKLNNDYTVIDTGFLDAVVMQSTYAVIEQNGKVADTIDKPFGIQEVNKNTYLYLTVTATGPLEKDISPKPGYKNSITGSFGDYILIADGRKQKLNRLIENFDDYFSSPTVINNKIYFWQLKTVNSDSKRSVSAAEYDPTTRAINSHYIKEDFIETDDSGYFPYPYIKNDTIYFDAGADKIMKYSKEFKQY